MFMILCVIHDIEKSPALLEAWEEAGVSGATILHSTGLGRIMDSGLWDDMPLFPGLDDLLKHEEFFNRTLFSVVDKETTVDLIVSATEKVLGDLSLPDTGLLVVLPVLRAYGLNKKLAKE
jgi:hypothetical protein